MLRNFFTRMLARTSRKKGANINATDSQGRTPLMIATYKNDIKIAKALIAASEHGYIDVIEELLT